MARSRQNWSQHQLEEFLGNLLRFGVVLSTIIVTVGGLWYLAYHGTEQPNYQIFRGEPVEFKVIPDILEKAVTFQRRRSLIQLGLLVLIATPIVRVAFSAYAFGRQRDITYVIITLIVLVILLYSLLFLS